MSEHFSSAMSAYLEAVEREAGLGLAQCGRLITISSIPKAGFAGWEKAFAIAYRPDDIIHVPQNVKIEDYLRDIIDGVTQNPTDGIFRATKYIYRVDDIRLWVTPIWGAKGTKKLENGATQRSFFTLYADGKDKADILEKGLSASLLLVQEGPAQGEAFTDLLPWSKVEAHFQTADNMPFNIEEMRSRLLPPSWVNVKIRNQTFFPQAPTKVSQFEQTQGGSTLSAFADGGTAVQRPASPTLGAIQQAATPVVPPTAPTMPPQAPTTPVQAPVAVTAAVAAQNEAAPFAIE